MIKLSKKGDYAIKSIIYLAKNQNNILKISDISSELKISEAFLRRIINDFEKSGILKTIKGRNGGVTFHRELKEINLYDILNIIGEDLNISDCTAGHNCSMQDVCVTTDVFKGLQKGFNGILRLYTLDKIVKNDN
ncbi:MAG: Rrf2 family transcriptional regulator [Candidatus Gracilibacteria bacterium]|nr:Rrf2 family transcriptional regulator [Candidatus Gracilibacteria bacterium]